MEEPFEVFLAGSVFDMEIADAHPVPGVHIGADEGRMGLKAGNLDGPFPPRPNPFGSFARAVLWCWVGVAVGVAGSSEGQVFGAFPGVVKETRVLGVVGNVERHLVDS